MRKFLTVAVALFLVFTLALSLAGCLDENSSEKEPTGSLQGDGKSPSKSEGGDVASDKLVNGMRAEFKTAMDGYEAFFDEYCAFMKKYQTSGDSLDMLNEYMHFMSQYTETMEKLDDIGDEELNDAELAYYTQVMTRINQKLLEVS